MRFESTLAGTPSGRYEDRPDGRYEGWRGRVDVLEPGSGAERAGAGLLTRGGLSLEAGPLLEAGLPTEAAPVEWG